MVINSKCSLLFPPALFPIRNCAQDSAFCQWFANFGSLALFPFLPRWCQMGGGGAESRLGSVSPSHRLGFRVIVSLSPSFLATPRHLWQTVYYGKGFSTQRFNYNGWLRILDSLFRTRRISRWGSCPPQLYLQIRLTVYHDSACRASCPLPGGQGYMGGISARYLVTNLPG